MFLEIRRAGILEFPNLSCWNHILLLAAELASATLSHSLDARTLYIVHVGNAVLHGSKAPHTKKTGHDTLTQAIKQYVFLEIPGARIWEILIWIHTWSYFAHGLILCQA